MRLLLNRLALIPRLLLALAGLASTATRADLVWTKGSGWTVEGGALSGLAGAEGRNALDQMNKARSAEEGGSLRSAVAPSNAAPAIRPGMSATTNDFDGPVRTTPRFGCSVVNG